MRLGWMRQDLGSARRATTFLLVLLVGSTLANLILATFAVRVSGRERIVVVPPSVHKTFWVEADRVSPEYLEEMGYFLMQLILNVTPQSVDHQAKVLLQYAAPAAFGELRTALLAAAERLKRDGAATVFSAQDVIVDERALKVGIRGQLTTFVSDRRVSDLAKGYAIEFQYSAGRLFLKAFRETSPNDPLETQPRPGAAPAGA
ncbi:MAG: type IV conjugative transfer system protein TraE [Burkholderiales bacterium]|nr:type IV conjugative transfer system protein TraE [Burkholderiales bacterium]